MIYNTRDITTKYIQYCFDVSFVGFYFQNPSSNRIHIHMDTSFDFHHNIVDNNR